MIKQVSTRGSKTLTMKVLREKPDEKYEYEDYGDLFETYRNRRTISI